MNRRSGESPKRPAASDRASLDRMGGSYLRGRGETHIEAVPVAASYDFSRRTAQKLAHPQHRAPWLFILALVQRGFCRLARIAIVLPGAEARAALSELGRVKARQREGVMEWTFCRFAIGSKNLF